MSPAPAHRDSPLMPTPTPVPSAPPSARQLTRSYLVAALLAPHRAVPMGWRMPGQALPVRTVLAVLPMLGPVFGTFSLLKQFF